VKRNAYQIVITMPASDGFRTRNDHHMAEIVGDHVHRLLHSHALPQGCEARLVRPVAGSPGRRAVEALKAIETFLAYWEGSDWSYSHPVQHLHKILDAARTGKELPTVTGEQG
jgi:hypothetical protein